MPFVSLGLVPEFASSLIVPQLMGNARAAEKLLLGDPFTGAEAVECGIANAVLPAAEVVNACAPHRRALQRAAARRGARDQAADARAAPRAAMLRDDRRRGRASSARACGARRRRRPSGLLREAQARLLAVLSAAGAAARCRGSSRPAAAPWHSSSRSRRCSWRRRWRRGAGRWCCPRRTGAREGSARQRRSADAAPARRRRFVGRGRRRGAPGAGGRRPPGAHAARAHRPRRSQWALRARTGLTTRGVHELLRAAPRCRRRRRRRRHRRQRRHRPGADARAPCAHRAALADWLLGRAGVRARRVRPAAADAPVPAAAAAAAPRRWARDARRHDAALARWAATRSDVSRACRSPLDLDRRRHGERRLPSRRAGVPRLRRGARRARRRGCHCRAARATSPRRAPELTKHDAAGKTLAHHRRSRAASAWRSPGAPRATAPTSSLAGQDHRAQPEAAGHDLQRRRGDRGRRRPGAAGAEPTSATRTRWRPRWPQAVERFGGIDILVNNASAISLTPTPATPMKRFDLMFGVNVRGTYCCTQACLPQLIERAKAGPQSARAEHVAAAVDEARTGSSTTSPTRWPSTA